MLSGWTPVILTLTKFAILQILLENVLMLVFNNILKNAVAYSDPNTEITISTEERNGNVEIMFFNHRKTIPSDQLEKMFDKFYKMDEARNFNVGGAGLGLAIAKEILAFHGGIICAKSENETVTIIVIILVEKSSS